MQTIGLIGGMSWESTVTYYQVLNLVVKRELGGLHSAKVLLHSVDFAGIEQIQAEGDWDAAAHELSEAACGLVRAGADFIVICTNTMHKVFSQVEQAAGVPVLHIADATAQALKAEGISRVALLGTKYTMTQDFYRGRLAAAGIDVIIPDDEGVAVVNDVIYGELCLGVISDESRRKFVSIIDSLADRGAQGVILGCTEIGLLIKQADVDLPVFDTTLIHAEAAAIRALEEAPAAHAMPEIFSEPKKKRSPMRFILPVAALVVVILAFVLGLLTFIFSHSEKMFQQVTGVALPESAKVLNYHYESSPRAREMDLVARMDAADADAFERALISEGFVSIDKFQSGGQMIPVEDMLWQGEEVVAHLLCEEPGSEQAVWLTEAGEKVRLYYYLNEGN